MAHIRGSHLVVSPDDLEDTTMSVHISSKTPNRRGSTVEEARGCIDSLGRYQPAGAQKEWNITVPMAFAALCASLANLARGFVLGYSSPSIPELKSLGLLADGDETSWYGSLTPIGSLIGALIGGFLTHRLGRKLSTMITCIPLAFGWLSIVLADSVMHPIGWLYLGRVLTGVGNGMSSLVTSVYVSEVASSNARGMLGTINQIATSVGVLIVYTLPFGMDYKWSAIFGGFNAALTMLLMTFMPETPRWLVANDRTPEAIDNFMWLRGCDRETAQFVILKLECEMLKQMTTFNIRELFTSQILKPFFVSQLSMVFQQLTGLFVLLFYTQSIFEMVGFADGKAATALMGAVTVIAYAFTPLLVERTGRRIMLNISAVGVFTSATVLGICFYIHDHSNLPTPSSPALIASSTSVLTTEVASTSANPLALTTALASTTKLASTATTALTSTAASYIASASSASFTTNFSSNSFNQSFTTNISSLQTPVLQYANEILVGDPSLPASPPPVSPILSYVALISTVGYMASYSLGYGPLPWVLISELIPLRARATVGGFAVFLTWGLSFLVTKIFAPLSDYVGVAGCFWIFASFSAVSLLYVAFLLPETKGRTLEEIEFYFEEGYFPDAKRRKTETRFVSRTPSPVAEQSDVVTA